eukprot:SAG22_NODE_4644_length_1207_cov_0.974729_2_plen_163_part_00
MPKTAALWRRSRTAAPPIVHAARGRLDARGPPVIPITPHTIMPALQPLIGSIDQPSNVFLDVADKVKAGEIDISAAAATVNKGQPKGPSISIDHSDINISTGAELLAKRDDAAPADKLLVSELLVTRLGCEATRKKRAKGKVIMTRHPRKARFNVCGPPPAR